MKTLLSDITLLTAAFNRHDLTLGMLKSFFAVSDFLVPITIIDNSTTTPIPFDGSDFITIINNQNFLHTPNYHQSSRNHCSSLQYAFEQINTRYVFLCDNDVLFYPSINNLFNEYHKHDAIGEISWDILPPDRFLPYCSIIDLHKMKAENISFFDPNRCIILNSDGKTTMDTGASFYEDITINNWDVMRINVSEYCNHLKGFTLHNKHNYVKQARKHFNTLQINQQFI